MKKLWFPLPTKTIKKDEYKIFYILLDRTIQSTNTKRWHIEILLAPIKVARSVCFCKRLFFSPKSYMKYERKKSNL